MSIKISNIRFSYDDFSLETNLEIRSGELLSILGPSGCGKTTLLRIIAGFISPEEGAIIINHSDDITRLPPAKRNIGMVFQDYALFPHLSVYRNISYGLEIRKYPQDKIKKRVSELLEAIGLSGFEKRAVHELSGGEKQRIALARALAPEPELLLFDEPLSALDVKLRKKLRREIRRIQQQLGFAAVYVTHDQEEAMAISDRIAVMNNGRIHQTGKPEDLYTKPVDYFTADFIGTVNTAETEIEDLPVRIMFRPEDCMLLINDSESGNPLLEATSVVSEYRGGYYSCEAITSHGEIIQFYNQTAFNKGDKIKLEIKRFNRF